MSRTTSQSSTATTNGLSRSLSLKTNTRTAQPVNPIPASDIKLFVTNLRLLDLDLRADWPNITVQTFSSKNADQKQRIGGVEWSLFRLFEIWDPQETGQKLQPFFPPLEPLQSRNLRAALYRLLNDLKKDGILGRESVLRKSMLDECKGDKFFEVLALFSTAVLKKVLASRQTTKTATVARRLATATTLSSSSQESLLPLAIANKAALINVLKRKDEKRKRFSEFERVLNAKSDEINQRIKKCRETPRARKPAVPQKEADAIKKQLKDNWIGNQKWLDVMLHGDDVQAEDAFLKGSFGQVWDMVEQGRKLEDAAPEVGLLQSLQSRVEEHQARLQKWKKFQATLQEGDSTSTSAPTKPPAPAKECRFDDHLQIQLRSKIPEGESIKRPQLRAEYQDILAEMDDELERAASAKYNQSSVSQLRRRGSSLSAPRSPARRRKSRSESVPSVQHGPTKPTRPNPPSRKQSRDIGQPPSRKQSKDTVTAPPPLRPVPVTTPTDSEATLVGQTTARRTAPQVSESAELPTEEHYAPKAQEMTSDALPSVPSPPAARPIELPSPSPSPPPPSSYYPSEPPVLEPEEALAAQIISSIGDATPSPIKKPQPRLSLMERTRLSMAPRTFAPSPISESSSLPSPPLPEPPTAAPDHAATLLERTRLSMAAMSHKPRTSIAPSKKEKRMSRQSLFPVNQFDTPRTRKSIQMIEESRSSGEKTPKEELFSEEAEYERVFKSRPRIATSPVWGTPVQGEQNIDTGVGAEEMVEDEDEYDEGVTGVDLADVDADEDEEGFTEHWENSPLRRAGKGREVHGAGHGLMK